MGLVENVESQKAATLLFPSPSPPPPLASILQRVK